MGTSEVTTQHQTSASSASPLASSPPAQPRGSPPQIPILSWEQSHVHELLVSLGYPSYQQQLVENGITGEILVHLDHEALKDIGILSVGQRLAILRAIYEIKLRDNVPIEEGQWVPPSNESEHGNSPAKPTFFESRFIMDILSDRDNRLTALEMEIEKIHNLILDIRGNNHDTSKGILERRKLESDSRPSSATKSTPTDSAFPFLPNPLTNNPTSFFASFVNETSSSPSKSGSSSVPASTQDFLSRASHSRSGSFATHRANLANARPATPNGISSETPSSSSHTGHPPNISTTATVPLSSQGKTLSPTGSRTEQIPSGLHDSSFPTSSIADRSGINPESSLALQPTSSPDNSAPTSLASPPIHMGDNPQSEIVASIPLADGMLDHTSPTAAGTASAGSSGGGASPATAAHPISRDRDRPPDSSRGDRDREREIKSNDREGREREREKEKGSAADNPYRSFRVTLDDPCNKVLPAALKKYKINGDWRQYALFICYGDSKSQVQRCLTYDEKPLKLFQELKMAQKEPVFMLRHIKDLKSPIALAQEKFAARKERRRRALEEGDGDAAKKAAASSSSSHPHIMPKPGEVTPIGFALSIYPYNSERDDEFDVAVGDTFIILSKAKGWWVMQRDSPSGANLEGRVGWVPAGCLLETTHSVAGQPKGGPLNPQLIVSVSTVGIALMDYTENGSDELTIKKDDLLKVFKRYSHYSYVIKEETGERGWVPSWFVGRVQGSSSSSGGNGGTTTRSGQHAHQIHHPHPQPQQQTHVQISAAKFDDNDDGERGEKENV